MLLLLHYNEHREFARGRVRQRSAVSAHGFFARVVWKINFMDLSDMLAGSMTNPPALAFATNIGCSDAPNVAYGTVYPLTTLLRILSARLLAIIPIR